MEIGFLGFGEAASCIAKGLAEEETEVSLTAYDILLNVTGKKELYDIPSDIGETRNLAGKYPKVVKQLSENLGQFLRSSGAQRPSFKSTGKPCPWPDEI